MKIVVLGGGISTERNVSLVTATSVCKALRALGHKAIFVDMFLGMEIKARVTHLFHPMPASQPQFLLIWRRGAPRFQPSSCGGCRR